MADQTVKWEGVAGATDQHHTTGGRAWCLQDRTWCYPTVFCECCMEASSEYVVCDKCEGDGYVKVMVAP